MSHAHTTGRRWRAALPLAALFITLFASAGCGRMPSGEGPSPDGAPSQPKPVVNDPRFHDALQKAAAVYSDYGEVDDVMRWVPGLCRIAQLDMHVSRSDDTETHGDKLFWMFAKDRQAYVDAATGDQPVGQVLVKEAWASREATAEDLARVNPGSQGPTFRGDDKRMRSIAFQTIEHEGKHFTADHVKGLYVMLKLDPAAEGTDAGWVYGTLSPDGKIVTSSGRVASCMGCHEEATRDRMFGLKAPQR